MVYVRFIKIGYSWSGAILGLLMVKSNTEELLRKYLTILIRATKSVDKRVVGVEMLEQWHRLNVYRMSLIYYLEERKIEILCQEIKLSIGIKLKIISQ